MRLEQFANDRNVELILETETPTATAPGRKRHARVRRRTWATWRRSNTAATKTCGWASIFAACSNERNDIDVYSFEATAGTEVWLDIDRTTNTLNSVVELVDAAGQRSWPARTIRSPNRWTRACLYRSPPSPTTAVNPLQKVADEYQPHNASGLPKDFYSLEHATTPACASCCPAWSAFAARTTCGCAVPVMTWTT